MADLSTYYIDPLYRINRDPEPCRRVEKKKPDAQWHVYELARQLSRGPVLDIGCGDAAMLMEFFFDEATLGVDTADNIELCRLKYPRLKWETANLDAPLRLSESYPLAICADVIEHLRSPEFLLSELARLNRRAHTTIVLSTPDRIAKRGAAHQGPPPDSRHVREWSQEELSALLRQFGFQPDFKRLPSSRASVTGNTTLAAVCRAGVG